MRDLINLLSLGLALLSIGSRASADTYSYYAQKLDATKPPIEFGLTSKGGESFTFKTLRGKVALVCFGFTHCSNICPTTLANLSAAQRQLTPKERAQIQVVFISVDPQRDTPQTVSDYVSLFDPGFIGLTGTPTAIAKVAASFDVEYESDKSRDSSPDSYVMQHFSGAYVVGPSGKLIAYFRERQLQNIPRVVEDLRHFAALLPKNESNWTTVQDNPVVRTPRLTGRELYVTHCAVCHGADGMGVSHKYPPLPGSSLVNGSAEKLTALMVNGMTGKEVIRGVTYNGVMPGWIETLVPADLAEVMTYLRQSWGNSASSLTSKGVSQTAYKYLGRKSFWTPAELEALPGSDSPAQPASPVSR